MFWQVDMVEVKFTPKFESHEIMCPVIGKVKAVIQVSFAYCYTFSDAILLPVLHHYLVSF